MRANSYNKIVSNLGVAQLVARYLGVVEAAGSSPVTQTKQKSPENLYGIRTFLYFKHAFQLFCIENLPASTIVHINIQRSLDIRMAKPLLNVFLAPSFIK